MELAALKPLAAALVLPPAGPLLLALLGLLWARRHRAAGMTVVLLSLVALFAFSTNGVALLMARHFLPRLEPVQAAQLREVQAIVILGGGVLPVAPEYGLAQPSEHTLGRLRYGAWLAKRSGLPVAFAGGIGWVALDSVSEGSVARRVLQQEYGLQLRWLDETSRDTRENAARISELLRPAGVRRIALVTDATHMPRAAAHFRDIGFEVVTAPTGFPQPRDRLEWLPSAHGLTTSRTVLREVLARAAARID